MELSTKKPCNDHQRKKRLVTKIGTGGSVGAVIFLGGAFAIASAFIVRRKGRSSAVNRSEPKVQKHEPDDEPDHKPDEEEVLKIGSDDTVLSDEVTKEIVECDHVVSSQSSKLDAIDITEPGEKTVEFISPKEQEKRSVTDFNKENPDVLDNQMLPSQPAEEVSNEISREREEIENGARDGEPSDDGEIGEMNCEEAAEVAEMSPRSGESMEVCCDDECDEDSSTLTAVHKALHELRVDELGEENDRGVEMNNEGEFGGHYGDNGVAKSETNEEKESDLVAADEADQGECEVTTEMAGASERDLTDRMEAKSDLSKEVGIEDTRETIYSDSHVGDLSKEVGAEDTRETIDSDSHVGDLSKEVGVEDTRETIDSDSHVGDLSEEVDVEDTRETIDSDSHMIDSRAFEWKNIENDKKDCLLPNEIVGLSLEVNSGSQEVIKENSIIEESPEDRVKEDIAKEQKDETCMEAGLVDEADQMFPVYGHTEPNENSCSYNNEEENASPENPELGDHDKNVDTLHIQVLQKEIISSEGIEAMADEDAELHVNDEGTEATVDEDAELHVNDGGTEATVDEDAELHVSDESIEATADEDAELNVNNEGTEATADEDADLSVNDESIEATADENAELNVNDEGTEATADEDAELNVNDEGAEATADEDTELDANDEEAITESVVCQQKDSNDGPEQSTGEEAEAESSNVTVEMSRDEEINDEVNIMETDDEMDGMDSSEAEEGSIESQDSSAESNTEDVLPTKSLPTMDQEMDRKTLEDKLIITQNGFKNKSSEIKGERDSAASKQITESNIRKATENSMKYVMELAMVTNHPGNAKVRMMLIITLSLLSSYLCSRLFDCSFVKLSAIMFFTMALSRIRSY